jgi:hypothetical protein
MGQLLRLKKGRERFEELEDCVWGYMHEECFLLAIGDPAIIRKQAPLASLISAAQPA